MLKNMKIAKKLIIAFITVVIISSISGIVGLSLLNTLDRSYSEALIVNGFVQGDIGNYNTYLQKGASMARDVIMLTDPTKIKSAQDELNEAIKLSEESFNIAKQSCQTPDELELINKIDVATPKYNKARNKAVELGLQNKNDEALLVFINEAKPYLNECISAGQNLMKLNSTMGNDVSNKLTSQSRFGMVSMVIVVVIATVVAIAVAILVASSISKPVKACENRLRLLSEGDLHTDVPKSNSNDEIGMMLQSLKSTTDFMNTIINEMGRGLGEMASGNLDISTDIEFKGDFVNLKDSLESITISLNGTLGQINIASDQVSSGSEQVSSGAQALSQGATEQASSVEELAATINEILEQVKNNANNAQNASGKADNAGVEVTQSNKKMQELVLAMQEINNSSHEISKVIKTIEDIAFQTNILALNAAVEAARAGDAGKGFAVVADEVRNLASKSAEAAKSTTELIEGSIRAVENGTILADDTAKSLISVVDGTNEVSTLVDKISVASNEQADSIAQVTQGIDQISAVVQTNSATAQQSAAASEELSGQAAMLRQLVSKFKLKANAENFANSF